MTRRRALQARAGVCPRSRLRLRPSDRARRFRSVSPHRPVRRRPARRSRGDEACRPPARPGSLSDSPRAKARPLAPTSRRRPRWETAARRPHPKGRPPKGRPTRPCRGEGTTSSAAPTAARAPEPMRRRKSVRSFRASSDESTEKRLRSSQRPRTAPLHGARAQRAVLVRQRQEVQEMLRRAGYDLHGGVETGGHATTRAGTHGL